MSISIIDLFCGAGGISSGMQDAGASVIAGFDNDKDALVTFDQNHDGAHAVYADLSKESDGFRQYSGVDMVVGGPPCQGFSISGKRDPQDGRNHLYKIYSNILKTVQPKMFILENVPNMISMDGGRFKEDVVKLLGNLGYKINVQMITASDYGVPQKRRRVFFFGHRDGYFSLDKDENLSTVTCYDAISDLPDFSMKPGAKYTEEPKSTYQTNIRQGSQGVWNHVLSNHSERTKEIISLVPDGGNYKDLPPNLQGTRKVNIAWTRYSSSKPSHTIDTGHRHHFHYKFDRIPTVRENARLQSFKDSFIFHGSKTSQYRQVGNAVPPLLASQILEQLRSKGLV